MKIYIPYLIVALGLCASCKKNAAVQAPFVISIAPDTGSAYFPVYITGINFDTVAADIIVKFNGVSAPVYSVTDSALIVQVPVNATTGKITISVNGHTVSNSTSFVILSGGSWVQKA
ncbi:MAG TPA: IPT/TIG domain-containing protein, partial [Puia sp.]|nr:IPT/TIG domain-containing protein [Puia sp.]